MATKVRVGVTSVYERNREATATTVINVGGARSSKSYSIAQLLIEKLVNESHKNIGICRKTFPALRMSTYNLVIGLLRDYGIYNRDNHNKTEHTYQHGTNTIWFFSLDEPEKIKSTEFNYIWMEEGNEFTYEDYVVLKLRLSGPVRLGERNQIFLSLNPVDGNNWIAKKLILETGVSVIHSTYKDNPFLDKVYVDILISLLDKDPNFHRIYALGEWGKLEHLIYPHYRVVKGMPQEFLAGPVYGLDFGYVNPTALVEVGLREGGLYWDEKIYQTHLTNSDLIELLKGLPRRDIIADSAEPQRIEEIARAGFNIYPSAKDIQMRIDFCRRQGLNITEWSTNIIREVQGYSRQVDRNGNVLETPVKFNDHAMDAGGYAAMALALMAPSAISLSPAHKERLVMVGLRGKEF